MKKLIIRMRLYLIRSRRNIIEKLYYKTFPDRKYDHEIATAPIPVIREERYRPITLHADRLYHKEETAYLTDELIKRDLLMIMTNELINNIKVDRIESNGDYFADYNRYRGSIKILKEDFHYEKDSIYKDAETNLGRS